MENKNQTTVQGQIESFEKDKPVQGQDIGNVCQRDGKIYARLDWLRLWPKNPRIIDKKNSQRLEEQIKTLGIYKPLISTPDGEILGGNQRYKIFKELAKKDDNYQWVWISLVEAWSYEERIRYALSDNFSAGEYTREKLKEMVEDSGEQASFFEGIVEFGEKKTMQSIIDELAMSGEELKLKELDKTLEAAGLDKDIIQDVKEMSAYNKETVFDKNFDEESAQGEGVNEYKDAKVYVLKLYFDKEEVYNEIKKFYFENTGSPFDKSEKFNKSLINFIKKYGEENKE